MLHNEVCIGLSCYRVKKRPLDTFMLHELCLESFLR